MAKLIVKNKSEIIAEYIIGNNSVNIGRSEDNNIRIDDKSVSERHGVIRHKNNKFEVEDFDTAFGTAVNGVGIKLQEIDIGSQIQIGNHIITLSQDDARSSSSVSAYLLGIYGKMEGKKFELNKDVTKIGRSEEFNHIWISKDYDKSVSRRHATIVYSNGAYVLSDKRSRNRTFVNKRQINKEDEIPLKNNDEILIEFEITDDATYAFLLNNKDFKVKELAISHFQKLFHKLQE